MSQHMVFKALTEASQTKKSLSWLGLGVIAVRLCGKTGHWAEQCFSARLRTCTRPKRIHIAIGGRDVNQTVGSCCRRNHRSSGSGSSKSRNRSARFRHVGCGGRTHSLECKQAHLPQRRASCSSQVFVHEVYCPQSKTLESPLERSIYLTGLDKTRQVNFNKAHQLIGSTRSVRADPIRG